MDINTTDINNINLDDNDFGTMIDVILVAWCDESKQRKAGMYIIIRNTG